MKKLVILFGRSCVGKTTVQKELERIGFKSAIRYTTRPIRENEINGVDYNFISGEEFTRMILNNEFVSYEVFNGWHYGIHKGTIDLESHNYVIALAPESIKKVRKHFGEENCVSVYLYLENTWNLLYRAIKRQVNGTHEECKEICRRFLADDFDFNVALINQQSDLRVENSNYINSAIEIEHFVKESMLE